MRHKGDGAGHYGLEPKKRKVREINVMLTEAEEKRIDAFLKQHRFKLRDKPGEALIHEAQELLGEE